MPIIAPIKTILIIDDEESFRKVVTRVLQAAGFAVIEVGAGKQGFQRLAQEKVDLVLTDIIMPDMEGVEIIVRLRREYPGLPVIAMSGGGSIGAADCLKIAKGVGASAALAKPFTGPELLEAIKSATPERRI